MKHPDLSLKLYKCTYNGKTKTILASSPRIAQFEMANGLGTSWSSKKADKVIVEAI